MSQQKKKKRFKYFVDKPFQTKFILNFIGLVLISAIISLGFILYIDSQKFSRGVLFEELVKDFYKTTDLSIEAVKLRNTLSRITYVDNNTRSKILADIDSYVRNLSKTEENIKKALDLKKKLVSKTSFGGKDSIFNTINGAVEKGNVKTNDVNIRANIAKWQTDIQRGIHEYEFDNAIQAIDNVLSILSNPEDIKVVGEFRKDFVEYKELITSSYNFLKTMPTFISDVESITSKSFSEVVDGSLISSLNASVSKISSIINGITDYGSVLEYETRTYGKKPYNLLDLYWKPVVALSLLQIILIIVFGLFFSHRIAGPVHRIKKELKEIAEGKLPITHEIKLRKNDFLLDIAREINNTLKSISERYNLK